MFARIVAVACVCMLSAEALAADRGFYLGFTGGQARYDFESQPLLVPIGTAPGVSFGPVPRPPGAGFGVGPPAFVIEALFIPAGAAFSLPGADDEETTWSFLAGYRFMKYLAAELAYVDLGKLTAEFEVPLFPVTGQPSPTIQVRETLATHGPVASVLGILPLTDTWDVYARAGVYFLDSELESYLGDGRGSTTFGSDGVVWGAGTQLAIGRRWTVRLDFQRYDGVGQRISPGVADIDVFSLGVLYRL